MTGAIIGALLCIIAGVACVFIGILNRMGNIKMLHSYHINNIKEEDIIPFGKVVGIGMIIIGSSIIIYGSLLIPLELTKDSIYMIIGDAVLITGIVLGIVICLYAIKKYNKKIFGF